jgi:hypothetical protein
MPEMLARYQAFNGQDLVQWHRLMAAVPAAVAAERVFQAHLQQLQLLSAAVVVLVAVLELAAVVVQAAALVVTQAAGAHQAEERMVVQAALFNQIAQTVVAVVVAPEVMFIVAVEVVVLELLVTHKVVMVAKVVLLIPNLALALGAAMAETMVVAVADQVVTMVVEQEVDGQMSLLPQGVWALRLFSERHNFNIIIKQTHLLGGFFTFCLIINRR